MKKIILPFTIASLAIGSAQAVQIFVDDFEAYSVANPATDPLDSDLFDPNNVTWTPSSTATDAHRIFDTGNFGGSRLWISLVNGTSLTSSGIAIQDNMTYTLDFFAASETFNGASKVTGSVDILVGNSLGSATSVIGGAQIFQVSGDNVVVDDDKSDHMFQQSFNSGTITPGDQMFVVFTRVGVPDAAAWFAIDDVTIDEAATVPEPSSSLLVSLGAMAMLLRRRR